VTRPKAVQVVTQALPHVHIYIALIVLQIEMARSKSWSGFRISAGKWILFLLLVHFLWRGLFIQSMSALSILFHAIIFN
jgi:hypothetical protein